jgi:hypothetical protein
MHLRDWRRWGRASGVAAAGLLATGLAHAQAPAANPVGPGSPGSVAAPEGVGDHAAAQALVLQVEHDAGHATVTADAVASAKGALERATRLRAAGDETHARAADGLALEWAQTARDVARAVDAEATAADLRRKAVDAQAQLERTRAQIEEGIAHVGRLRAQLGEVDKAGKVERVAVEVHEGDAPPPRRKGGKGGDNAAARKGAAPESKKPAKATRMTAGETP